MICGIYKITNQINNKIYIGQSTDIHRRWADEKARSKNPKLFEVSALYYALNKYGINNFTFEVIEECEPMELNDREWYWIQYYNSMTPNGYNLIKSKQQTPKQKFCLLCGKAINHNATYCPECGHLIQRKVERPDANTLKEEIIKLKGFAAVGRKYGVSDSTIKKWCKGYGLSTYAKDYKIKKEKPTKGTIRQIAQIDPKTNEIIKIWNNAKEAAVSLGRIKGNQITDVCNGNHKTAYGYIWRYLDTLPIL